jgi:hypothetical protein
MLFFIFIIVKTTLKISVIKTTLKNLRKIRTIAVLILILITTILAFKVSVIKTASKKHFS